MNYDAQGNATTKDYTPAAATRGSGSRTMFANGNHNMSVADVDGDGRDEIIWGSATLNSDGTVRYATGYGHGDAIHVGQMIPGNTGLQVFEVHEEGSYYGWDLHDANTGKVLHTAGSDDDNGRGMAAQLTSQSTEWWFSSAGDRQQRSADTGEVGSPKSGSLNFRMYWDGTPQDALLDGSTLDKYDDAKGGFNRLVTFYNLGPGSTCNGSKNTPNLSGDILGDWREELILYHVGDDETYLGIYSTNIKTGYTVPTLMHDHTYRMAICWQNVAYNQPPHLGYNLADSVAPRLTVPLELTTAVGEEVSFVAKGRRIKTITLAKTILPDGTEKASGVPDGFTRKNDIINHAININGTAQETGDYQFVFNMTGMGGEKRTETIVLHVNGPSGIGLATASGSVIAIYNLEGHQLPVSDTTNLPHGIYLVKMATAKGLIARKVVK